MNEMDLVNGILKRDNLVMEGQCCIHLIPSLRARMSWLKFCHTLLTPFPTLSWTCKCVPKKIFGLVIAINWICRSDDCDTFISSDYVCSVRRDSHFFLEMMFVWRCRHRKIICIFLVIKYPKVSARWSGNKRLGMRVCVVSLGKMKNWCDLSTLANQQPLKQMLLLSHFENPLMIMGSLFFLVNATILSSLDTQNWTIKHTHTHTSKNRIIESFPCKFTFPSNSYIIS